MNWERTFDFSATVDTVWDAFTNRDAEFRVMNPDNAYQSGGAVKIEFTTVERNQSLAWTETEGENRWDMSVSFTETETGTRITITRSGFGDSDDWLMAGQGRMLGWEDVLSDLEIYFRTGVKLNRLYSRQWGATGMQIVEDTGGLRVTSVVPGGLAASAGIEPGDLLVRANGAPLIHMSDHWFLQVVLKPDADVEFEYLRGNELRTSTAQFAGAGR